MTKQMPVTTAWVKRPYHIKGLDPLAVQAPCINIYGQLLPGITNVTDRARYYSFYPWMVWTFDQQTGAKSHSDLVTWIRRADCLFTLIGIRHHLVDGQNHAASHDMGLVGSQTLRTVAKGLQDDATIRLSDYTMLESDDLRYFKNKMGGLGQYYIGTFDNLGLMRSRGKEVVYTPERGQPLAEALDKSVNGELFMKTVYEDVISAQRLDDLASFCPCNLLDSEEERKALTALFFDQDSVYGSEGRRRRRSLGLLLDLIRSLPVDSDADGANFDQHIFRGSVYSGCLPGGTPWKPPRGIDKARAQWAIYQRNELLSLATQCIFWVALKSLEHSRQSFFTTEDFMTWFASYDWVRQTVDELGGGTVSDLFESITAELPLLTDWEDSDHEISMGRKLRGAYRERNDRDVQTEVLSLAARVLLSLCIRDDARQNPYEGLSFPDGYLSLYPINLRSLLEVSREIWPTMDLTEWLSWVAGRWGIDAHLRVALRKLRQQSQDTFHILPTDHGLKVEADPVPTYTAPRFTQAVQMLHDLGAIERAPNRGWTRLSTLGEDLWRRAGE